MACRSSREMPVLTRGRHLGVVGTALKISSVAAALCRRAETTCCGRASLNHGHSGDGVGTFWAQSLRSAAKLKAALGLFHDAERGTYRVSKPSKTYRINNLNGAERGTCSLQVLLESVSC